MQVLKNALEAATRFERTAVALGNFDGVHIGHKHLIRKMVNCARNNGIGAVVFTFHPHPSQVLFPDKSPRLLVSPERRTELISTLGVDALLMMPFNLEVAQFSPTYFVEEILHRQLKTNAIFVGFNYTFGHKGAGTPELLQSLGHKLGIQVEVLPPVQIGNTPVSSTVIRQALDVGDIQRAKENLGYWPILEGRVVPGYQRGSKQLGFPTANLDIMERVLIPAKGVYVAEVKQGERIFRGVVNIGVKPTFGEGSDFSVEVHILDFDEDIYNDWLQLSLFTKLRDEIKFSTITELAQQIGRDVEFARSYPITSKVKHA